MEGSITLQAPIKQKRDKEIWKHFQKVELGKWAAEVRRLLLAGIEGTSQDAMVAAIVKGLIEAGFEMRSPSGVVLDEESAGKELSAQAKKIKAKNVEKF